MTDKLEALSQPVAYDYQMAGACIADGDTAKWVDWEVKLTRNFPPDWMIEEGKVKDLKPRYSQEYVTALIQRAVAAELREKETSARAAQADLWAKALVELDEKMKEAARILKSGERLALSRAIKILEGQDDD